MSETMGENKDNNLEMVCKTIVTKTTEGDKNWTKTIESYKIKNENHYRYDKVFAIIECLLSLIIAIVICCFFLTWGCNEQKARIEFMNSDSVSKNMPSQKQKFKEEIKNTVVNATISSVSK